jgi:hypothetical protein
MSTPPSAEAMMHTRSMRRSSMMQKYNSRAMSVASSTYTR